jgi:adenylate kinase family enzyme
VVQVVTSRRQRPLVLELVGPAGAGKTTLRSALCRRDPRIVAGVRVGRLRQARLMLRDGAALLPTFVRRHRADRWFNRAEIRAMSYLGGWLELLEGEAPGTERVTVLDHGPVFRLAALQEFGPAITRSAAFERWSARMLESWRWTLDRVVWLDATDDVLIGRIRGRAQKHGVKDRPDAEMREFLTRYRRRLESVLESLSQGSGPLTLRFDTARQSAPEIAAAVLATLPEAAGIAAGSDRRAVERDLVRARS